MQRRKSILAVTLLLFLSASRHSTMAAEMQDLAVAAQSFQHIAQLLETVDTVRSWEQDGLYRRIDQLGLAHLDQLNVTATALLSADGVSEDAQTQLTDLLDTAMTLALSRDEELEQRAAKEHESFGKFEQSPQADIARVFIEDLQQLRQRYLLAIVVQLDTQRAAGQGIEALEELVNGRVSLFIERLTGQIRLDAMSLDGLSRRLTDKPLDDNVKAALELVKAKQSESLEVLEGMIEVASLLGIDTTEQRSQMILERGKIDVDILELEVFGALWKQEIETLRSNLTRYTPDLLLRLLLFSLILILTWILAQLIRYPVRALLSYHSVRISSLLREAAISLCSFIIMMVGILVALASAGVSLGPILAGLGVLGIVVGLAIQDSLGNLAAGAMILIYRPYDMDDHINVNGAEGLVKRMNMLATTVTTFDNQSMVIPNGRIWGDTIINYTAHQVRRVDIKVNIAYAENPDRVQVVLVDLLKNQEYVLQTPEPTVHMSGMEDSSVAMMVKPWVRTADYWTAYWDLTRLIKQRLDSEGIEIPFPQRVVTLKQDDLQSRSTL